MSSSKIALLAAPLGAMTVWACAAAPSVQPVQAAQAAPAPAPAPPPAAPAAPPASRAATGEELLNTVCTQCHTLDNLKASPHKADDWPEVIDKMVQFGAEISAEDRKAIEAYLAAHYSTPG
jgi:mono/diheme cytochrome c family protein